MFLVQKLDSALAGSPKTKGFCVMNTNNNSDIDLISVPPTNLLIAALGNAHAAIILQHLCFCYLKFGRKEFHRTIRSMSVGDEEDGHLGTGLTKKKIQNALDWLKKHKLISTINKFSHNKPPPKLHFKVHFNEIKDLLSERGYNSLISPYLSTGINLIYPMGENIKKNITALEEEFFKRSELLRNSPDSQNPTAQDQNSCAESQSAQANPTEIQPMTTNACPLDDLIAALTGSDTTEELPKKKRKIIRQRKPREQRMLEAKQSPEEFNPDEKQFYEEGWVVHLSKRGCSAAQLEEHKALWLKFKQENFNIVLMMRYYVAEGVYGVSEQRVRFDIEKGKHKVIKSKSTPESNVVSISKKPKVSKMPSGYVIAN